MSNSAGVCTAIKHSLNVNPVKLVDVSGRILGVDFTLVGVTYQVLNVYAPMNGTACRTFFNSLSSFFVPNTYLLGDFNSVTENTDNLSRNLDSTSVALQVLLDHSGMFEPQGSHHHCFTFHCPGDSSCQRRIDHIYTNFTLDSMFGYNFHLYFSDH